MVRVAGVFLAFWSSVLYYTRPFADVVFHYIYTFFCGNTKPLPPIEDKILLLSATQLADKIRKRELKSEDVLKAYIKRAKIVQPYINAITEARYEEALEDAKKVDRFLATTQKSAEDIEKDTPLLGVPFTCKEAIGVKGLAQTAGIVNAKTRKCPKDSDSAALYRAAGAIPLTVTNVPERCMWWDSSNLNFGICKNPYNNHRVVGGSSGGEAALITSAGALIGIGSDFGGSIRVPSSFNGIYGLKPTPGVVPRGGEFPDSGEGSTIINQFFCTGPMCRYVDDLHLLLKILSANDKRIQLQNKVDFKHVKIYYIESFPGKISAVPVIKAAVLKAVSYFEEQYGIKAVPLNYEELEIAFPLWECKYLETNIPSLTSQLTTENGTYNKWLELLKNFLRISNHTIPIIFFSMLERRQKDDFYYKGLQKLNTLKQKFQNIFSENAIVLLPTHPELPPYYHLTIPKFYNAGYTAIFNVLGFPSVNIPAGMSNGVPIGIQAVSGPLNDHLCICTAQELDKCFGGWKSPAMISVK